MHMMTDHSTHRQVAARHGIRSVVLAPCSVAVAAMVAAITAFTPLVFVGPQGWVAVFCGSGMLVASIAVVLAAICWSEAAAAPSGTPGRQRAINWGRLGVVLSATAMIGLSLIWIWLPGQLLYRPLWT